MATAADIIALSKQTQQILERVERDALSVPYARAALQLVMEGRVNLRPTAWFTSPQLQAANFLVWNNLFGFGFREKNVADAFASGPLLNLDLPFVAPTLCWTLRNLESTIDAKLRIMELVYGEAKILFSQYINNPAIRTTLVRGAPEFVPFRLWWETIDLEGNRHLRPNQVPAARALGTEIFDVACDHPEYIKRQDGHNVPYIGVPGLRMIRSRLERYSPYVRGFADGNVHVGVRRSDAAADSNFAEPVRRPVA